MVITVLTSGQFLVKPGVGSHVHLTAQDRLNSCFLCRTVEIDHTIHNTVIGDRCAVHAQFLDSGYIFFNLIGSVQQRIFCMDMKMGKRHFAVPFLVQFFCFFHAFLVGRSYLFPMITRSKHRRKIQVFQCLFLCRCGMGRHHYTGAPY